MQKRSRKAAAIPYEALRVDRSVWPGWATVENDPVAMPLTIAKLGIIANRVKASFNYMLRGIGVSNAIIEEVLCLDDETMEELSYAWNNDNN